LSENFILLQKKLLSINKILKWKLDVLSRRGTDKIGCSLQKKIKEEINGDENDDFILKMIKKDKNWENNFINQLSNKSLKIKRRLTSSKIEGK